MDKASVTVIVPIYNVEKYLEECLQSLERQKLKGIEVILVNDGSTDHSAEIAKEYCDRNTNFKLINRKNGGLSAARNTGLDTASGEYIHFLDSDDYLADEALEKLYEKAKAEDLDALRFSAYCFEDGTREFTWQHYGGYKFAGEYPDIYNGTDFYLNAINNTDYYPSCCLIIMKRSHIEENGLRFVEGIVHEDNLFYFEVAMLSKKIAVMNEPLYYRRFRSGSITQLQDWMNKNRSMCISVEMADKFIENHPLIKGVASDWQMNFFINTMFANWDLMSTKEQYSKESRGYFARVKPLLKKYGTGEDRTLKLFYVSYTVYKFYRWLKITARKIISGI